MRKKIISYLLIVIGISITCYPYLLERRQVTEEHNKIAYTLEQEAGYRKVKIEDTYDLILEIPQINLKKGIYKKNDKRNNINENVVIHEKSDYPNVYNSNLILFAHSGIGLKAYFNDLVKLNEDSLVKVYYKNKKYTYKIDHYDIVSKDGTIEIIRDKNKKTITLITCSQQDKSKQLVYIGYLIDEI